MAAHVGPVFPLKWWRLLDHITSGRDQSCCTTKHVSIVLVGRHSRFGHRGERQLVMFQNGDAVLLLLFLQVEHLPQLLQLLQLAEGLQHHQHHYKPQDQVD